MRIVGIIFVLLSLPVFIGILKAYPQQRKWSYFSLGLLPFIISALNLDAAFISWGAWTGYTTGFILSVLDTLALSILITSGALKKNFKFSFIIFFYLFAVFISIFQSSLWMSTAFYVFQFIRVCILFYAVASFAGNYSSLRWLFFGLSLGAIYQGIVTVEQKASGVVQAFGTMGHQNLLGLMLHFVTLPLLSVILAGERSKIIIGGVLAALLCVALGASRASLGFLVVGLLLLTITSLLRKATLRKWKVIGASILTAGLVAPLAYSTLADRFQGGEIYAGPDGERLAFERAAREMWSNNPMGVGANQYVIVANTEGYSDRAGVTWNWSSRATKVHNMYLLAGAETGWIGFIALILLILYPIATGLTFAIKNRSDDRGDIVLGATIAFIVIALHGLYEWVFFMVHAQYLFAISLGVISSNVHKYPMRRRLQRIPVNPDLVSSTRAPHASAHAPIKAFQSMAMKRPGFPGGSCL